MRYVKMSDDKMTDVKMSDVKIVIEINELKKPSIN